MALDRTQLMALAKATAKASLNPSTAFAFGDKNLTYEALNETFRKEMNELAGTYAQYRENKNLIFSLIEVGLDEVLPAKVLQNYGQFADVKTYAQGDKPVFRVRISEASKKRAKGFVTRVGLAGRYEVFKLDGYTLEVPTSAYGGAAQIGFEEFLDGRITMSDVYDLVLEGLDEVVYKEIAKALVAMADTTISTAYNKSSAAGFDEAAFDRLVATADAYGKSTIYCTYEFAAQIAPGTAGSINWSAVSDRMKDDRWNNGYFTLYKGHSVIVLPQSFEDTDNYQKVIDPRYAWIIPTGAEKPVKIAFEGAAAVKEHENDDWSREIETYKKFGVAVYNKMINPGICVYKNTALSIYNTEGTWS
ncbi:MAG: hypothetical protein IKN65_06380 [Clostridia bacterium]|nr:hypothetical protein [Clostridia bacterium]